MRKKNRKNERKKRRNKIDKLILKRHNQSKRFQCLRPSIFLRILNRHQSQNLKQFVHNHENDEKRKANKMFRKGQTSLNITFLGLIMMSTYYRLLNGKLKTSQNLTKKEKIEGRKRRQQTLHQCILDRENLY